ncbi:hypothetical protein SAMN06309944_0694 [Micrococcales bacterium KH10]|nr:hypothetical protein SAMN06309944_0694 [Micrococcales bacterium KH10]
MSQGNALAMTVAGNPAMSGMTCDLAGAPEHRVEADGLAAAWMKDYDPLTVSYSVTESERGITYRNQYNDITWLIFDADKCRVVSEPLDWNRTEEHA